MFRLKYIFIILSIIFIIFFIFNPAVEAGLNIAFLPKSLDNPIFLDTFEAAHREAEELGVNLMWVAPFTTDTGSQADIIDSLIDGGVDGIIISANDSSSLERVINRAVESGIPVATFDSDSPESKRLFYVGTDNYQAGVNCGRAVKEELAESGLEDKKLKTVILTGDRMALNLNKRIIGFKKTISDSYQLDIREILYCRDNIQLAIELIEDYIGKNPDLDLVFFTGGWPFYVPADAMPNFQQWAADGGIAVGIDIFYSALLMQEQGLIDHLVGQDFKEMGRLSLRKLVAYLRFGEQPSDRINTNLTEATEENLQRLLKTYKSWEVK